jgi:hypothetical protein
MQGVVNVFGRISFLIDQNTQAFHMFMSALLQVKLVKCPLFLSLKIDLILQSEPSCTFILVVLHDNVLAQ